MYPYSPIEPYHTTSDSAVSRRHTPRPLSRQQSVPETRAMQRTAPLQEDGAPSTLHGKVAQREEIDAASCRLAECIIHQSYVLF